MAAAGEVFRLQLDIELPDDIHRRVLQSPSLSLADLALMAPTCKLFHEVCREARVAEEAWLDKLRASAESTIGPRVLDAFCEWLFPRDRQDFRDSPIKHVTLAPRSLSSCPVIDITKDAMLAHPQGKLDVSSCPNFFLRAPAWGLQGEEVKSNVLWSAKQHCHKSSEVYFFGPAECIKIDYMRREDELHFLMEDWPAALVPTCIGFLHRILERHARVFGRQGGRRDLILALPETVKLGGSITSVEGGVEVLRALSALRMRHTPRWKFIIR